jgi:hypothetical protein
VNILFQNVSLFEVEDMLSYCIVGLEILGDLLLYKINLENHPWGVKILPYLECMKGFLFGNWILCLKFIVGNNVRKTYVHISGWWILCAK